MLDALMTIRNCALSSRQLWTRHGQAALAVVDRKLVGLQRKRAWRNAIAGTIPPHMNLPRPEVPEGATKMPVIVCLCGSTRFGATFAAANLRETLAGKIVLSIGCNLKSDAELFADQPPAELARIKRDLDELHKRKIDLADEVLVLNVGGYIGESTRSEIEHAKQRGKPVRYLEPLPGESEAMP